MTTITDNFRVVTHDTSADAEEERWRIVQGAWAEFLLNDPTSDKYWDRLNADFPEFQFSLYDGDRMIAYGNSIPVRWDGTIDDLPDEGWKWALEYGMRGFDDGVTPNLLSALSITVDPALKGTGISRYAVNAMREIAAQHELSALVAPVRPNLKHRYPLTPMERYLQWTHNDGSGLSFDPWIRTHQRVGGRIMKVAPSSMVIPGTVAQWESWTGMRFPETGSYIVESALNPVAIDVEADRGVYVEPNVWLLHDIQSTR